MSMLDFDGSVKYVWNPFSRFQLKAMLGDFDAYLECVSSKDDASCAAMTPKNDVFEQQQIPCSPCTSGACGSGDVCDLQQDAAGSAEAGNTSGDRDTFGVSKCLLKQRENGYDTR